MKPRKDDWIGVDLDGTLAEYHGFIAPDHIGAPIPEMVERVKRWLADGWTVKVLTARMSHPDRFGWHEGNQVRIDLTHLAIREWTLEHIGQALEATCTKDYRMVEFWDDRAVTVMPNSGVQLTTSRVDGPAPIQTVALS